MAIKNNHANPVMEASADRLIKNLLNESFFNTNSEHVTFHMISYANNLPVGPYIKTTYPAEWISYYLFNSLIRVDPIIRTSRGTHSPFFWSKITLTAAEANMMSQAKEFVGGTIGYSVPTYDIGPYRWLFFVCTHQADDGSWEEKIKQRQ